MNLFVRNLDYNMSDEDLREVFEKIGDVISARVIMDRQTGRSRGFGFVEMASREDGIKAIDELNGKEVNGRAIAVDKAKENSRR